jgi:hypothetical protein
MRERSVLKRNAPAQPPPVSWVAEQEVIKKEKAEGGQPRKPMTKEEKEAEQVARLAQPPACLPVHPCRR